MAYVKRFCYEKNFCARAYVYPDGKIPSDKAALSIIIVVVTIIIEGTILGIVIMSKPSEK